MSHGLNGEDLIILYYPPAAAITGTGVPVRNGYGGLVPTQNKASYDAAVSAQGPDNQDTKLWWDTK